MIELPRAALLAGEIAESAEFFSFGTNDLTQTTFGISRDDAASFLGIYTARGILAADPFVSIDQQGVGELVQDRRRARAQDPAEAEGRHLRRAWRRPGLGRLLPRGQARLRVVLAVPRADRAACRGAGGAGQDCGQPGVARRLHRHLGEEVFDFEPQIGDRAFPPSARRRARFRAEERVSVAAPATSPSTATTWPVPCAALATLCEISPVADVLLFDRGRDRRGVLVDLLHARGDLADRLDRAGGRVLHAREYGWRCLRSPWRSAPPAT